MSEALLTQAEVCKELRLDGRTDEGQRAALRRLWDKAQARRRALDQKPLTRIEVGRGYLYPKQSLDRLVEVLSCE